MIQKQAHVVGRKRARRASCRGGLQKRANSELPRSESKKWLGDCQAKSPMTKALHPSQTI